MDDISTRDEEKARELALEKGREEERKRQEELERAKDDARKQAVQQERTRQKEKGGSIKYLIYVIVLAIVLIVVAWFSLNVTVTNVLPGNALPFTTNYGVSIP
jgi:membrane protein involved in colicin uptake